MSSRDAYHDILDALSAFGRDHLAALAFLEAEFPRLRAAGDPSVVLDAAQYAGVLAFTLADFDKAVEYYKEAACLAPDNPTLLLAVGMALERAGRIEEARSALERCIELFPPEDADLAEAASRRLLNLNS